MCSPVPRPGLRAGGSTGGRLDDRHRPLTPNTRCSTARTTTTAPRTTTVSGLATTRRRCGAAGPGDPGAAPIRFKPGQDGSGRAVHFPASRQSHEERDQRTGRRRPPQVGGEAADAVRVRGGGREAAGQRVVRGGAGCDGVRGRRAGRACVRASCSRSDVSESTQTARPMRRCSRRCGAGVRNDRHTGKYRA